MAGGLYRASEGTIAMQSSLQPGRTRACRAMATMSMILVGNCAVTCRYTRQA